MRRLDGHKRPAKIHQAATQLERVEVASGTLGGRHKTHLLVCEGLLVDAWMFVARVMQLRCSVSLSNKSLSLSLSLGVGYLAIATRHRRRSAWTLVCLHTIVEEAPRHLSAVLIWNHSCFEHETRLATTRARKLSCSGLIKICNAKYTSGVDRRPVSSPRLLSGLPTNLPIIVGSLRRTELVSVAACFLNVITLACSPQTSSCGDVVGHVCHL